MPVNYNDASFDATLKWPLEVRQLQEMIDVMVSLLVSTLPIVVRDIHPKVKVLLLVARPRGT